MADEWDDEDDTDTDTDTDIIRAKWMMDDAGTLSQAAEKLRDMAGWLEELERAGWQLVEPVRDDYGFIKHPEGKRLVERVDERLDSLLPIE